MRKKPVAENARFRIKLKNDETKRSEQYEFNRGRWTEGGDVLTAPTHPKRYMPANSFDPNVT